MKWRTQRNRPQKSMCNNGISKTMMMILITKQQGKKKKRGVQLIIYIYPAGEFKPDIDQS
jgi:hypothetical protein